MTKDKREKSPLTWMIESILTEARADLLGGRSPRKWGAVKGGLEIHIQFYEVNKFKLGLARVDTFPSVQEWKTVLEYWPEPFTRATEPPHIIVDKDKTRKWLVGKVTTEEQGELI